MVSPLTSLLSKTFSGGSSANSSVGIDIGSSSIKVVQISKKTGRLSLDTYGEISLGPLVRKDIGDLVNFDPETLTHALHEITREANITSKNAIVSIQAASSLIVVMRIPYIESDSRKELDEVISLEARKYIPIPMNQVTMDWWMVPSVDAGFQKDGQKGPSQRYSEVLVVAIRNEMLEKYQTMLKPLDLTSLGYEIEIFPSIRSTFRHEISSVVLVDMGAQMTRVAIVNYGIVRVFHAIKKGSVGITNEISKKLAISFSEAEDIKKQVGLSALEGTKYHEVTQIIENYMADIFLDIKRAVVSYEKEFDKAVGKMIVCGGGSRLIGLEKYTEAKFNIDVEVGDPFSKVDAPKFLDRALSVSGPSFAVAMGLAMKRFQ